MKHFETPEIEIIRFAVTDIITSSGELPVIPLIEEPENRLKITGVD